MAFPIETPAIPSGWIAAYDVIVEGLGHVRAEESWADARRLATKLRDAGLPSAIEARMWDPRPPACRS